MEESHFNLAAHVLGRADEMPDKAALEVLGVSRNCLTFGALRCAVLGVAQGLLDQGLQPGDRVLMRLGNTPDFPIAYLGAIAAGLVAVPTAAGLTEIEVAHLIQTLTPACILVSPEVACPDAPGLLPLQRLQDFYDGRPAPFHMGPADRPGYIVFTSGTSGKPRGVVHAHRAILARQMMHEGWYGLRASDRLLHAGAFNWTYTLGTGLMDPWTLGATALVPGPGVASTDLPGLLADHTVTIFAASPGVYRQALRAEMPPVPHLRHGLSAGEKLPTTTRRDWETATGTKVHEAFGMSECSTFISGSPSCPAAPGTLGAPQPGRRVEILGPDGPLPAGNPGTIAVHESDPGLMLGYLDAPENTRARYQGAWFLTGDLGVADSDGHITYLGRDDDMMNAGGFRVSPIEVEEVLTAHPEITGAACVELPVSDAASIIAAFYTGPGPVANVSLESFVAQRLARYKQPRVYRQVDQLPQSANGKIQRQILRKEWEGKI